jgi:diguanylate cyclase (GGDEF)-like protein
LLGAQDKLIGANRTLELLALEDAMTGLANRRQFDLFIRAEMGRAKRSQGSLVLLMIDVDHFKRFNNLYGHLSGDEYLRTISANIKRPGDLAARYGGEEFAVVLPGTDYVGAFLVAEDIRRAIQLEHNESTEGTVTLSLGVSACNPTSQESSSTGFGDIEGLVGRHGSAAARADSQARLDQ